MKLLEKIFSALSLIALLTGLILQFKSIKNILFPSASEQIIADGMLTHYSIPDSIQYFYLEGLKYKTLLNFFHEKQILINSSEADSIVKTLQTDTSILLNKQIFKNQLFSISPFSENSNFGDFKSLTTIKILNNSNKIQHDLTLSITAGFNGYYMFVKWIKPDNAVIIKNGFVKNSINLGNIDVGERFGILLWSTRIPKHGELTAKNSFNLYTPEKNININWTFIEYKENFLKKHWFTLIVCIMLIIQTSIILRNRYKKI